MSTTTAGTSEFDRFGPWIDEVREPADVPRLFRSYPLELDAARLVLKVPRNISRRDATPDMDLYDHLLVLDDEGLTVLSRRERTTGHDVVALPYAEIVVVRDVASLLDGRLTVGAADGTAVSVRYSGSARASTTRLVDALREAMVGGRAGAIADHLRAAASTLPRPGLAGVGEHDLALGSDYRVIARANPRLQLWACHGRVPLPPQGGGAAGLVRQALHALSPMTLHGAVVAADATALEVVGRHDWLVRGRSPVHSSSRLVVPWSGVDSLAVTAHPLYPGAVLVDLGTGSAPVQVVVPAGSSAHAVFATAAERVTSSR